MEIYRAGEILIVGIKRFSDYGKDNTRVITEYILDPKSILVDGKYYGDRQYKLYAVIVHMGSLHGGHYTAICYNEST
jgi:ubiquitin C-terminal hydrolase